MYQGRTETENIENKFFQFFFQDFNAGLGKGNTRSIFTKMRDFEQKTEILICCLCLKCNKTTIMKVITEEH